MSGYRKINAAAKIDKFMEFQVFPLFSGTDGDDRNGFRCRPEILQLEQGRDM